MFMLFLQRKKSSRNSKNNHRGGGGGGEKKKKTNPSPHMSCVGDLSITGQFICGSQIKRILLVTVFILGFTHYVKCLVESSHIWPPCSQHSPLLCNFVAMVVLGKCDIATKQKLLNKPADAF